MESDVLGTAIALARQGIPVIICKPDKTPYTPHGYKDATTDEATILQWFMTYPDAMLAIATGRISNVWCLDVDLPKSEGDSDGRENLKILLMKHGSLPETWTEKTPSGGLHFFFRYPHDGEDLSRTLGKLAPRLDVISDDGYVVVAPSINYEGKPYDLISKTGIPAEPPEWLVRLARDAKRKRSNKIKHPSTQPSRMITAAMSQYVKAAIEQECAAVRSATEGERNDTINRAAFALGQLVGCGALPEDVVRLCIREAALAMQDPLPEAEIDRTIESGITAGKEQPRDIPEEEITRNVSEESIAAAFAARYGDRLKYCAELGKWLLWNSDKHLWETDTKDQVFHYLRQECKAANPKNKPTLGKATTAKGVEKFARADPVFATTAAFWDADIFLLGTPEGVVDLRSGGNYVGS